MINPWWTIQQETIYLWAVATSTAAPTIMAAGQSRTPAVLESSACRPPRPSKLLLFLLRQALYHLLHDFQVRLQSRRPKQCPAAIFSFPFWRWSTIKYFC
ncbi:hypothetical protein B0H19DRAFT_1122112 [Mycena capillaripes]|nr:hypothetical protein B0H19DRAFT_1122112 [Mycena capillaripes]